MNMCVRMNAFVYMCVRARVYEHGSQSFSNSNILIGKILYNALITGACVLSSSKKFYLFNLYRLNEHAQMKERLD